MIDLDRRMLLGVASVAGIAAVARAAQAGSLNPLAGPVTPTMKPLDQVEPRTAVQSLTGDSTAQYVINQPGSYYLTANIIGSSGGIDGIKIATSNVTLDLCGFALLGVAGSGSGIRASAGSDSLAVSNGTVSSWGSDGVNINSAVNSSVDGVNASHNGNMGLNIGANCRVTECIANSNGFFGVLTGVACVLAHCVANQNTNGIASGAQCVLVECIASGNSSTGIQCGPHSSLRDCTGCNNFGSGVATNIGSGIQCGAACALNGCTANLNTGIGLSADIGSSVIGCSSASNTRAGIAVYGGSTLQNCSASQNGGDGIVVNSYCTVLGCNAFGNGSIVAGSAGIHATNGGNRFDGNVSSSNIGTGILSSSANTDITVRNNCALNTVANYNPAAGTTFGGVAASASAATAWSNF